MKIGLVHDDFMRKGGAERVAKVIHDTFPKATMYTLAFKPSLTYPEISNMKIITSWFNYIARNELLMKYLFFPLGILAMKSMRLSGYDLVIISTTYCGKYVEISPGTLVISYCYTPFRLAWNPSSYVIYQKNPLLRNLILNPIIHLLKKLDYKAAQRTDYFIAMTQETKRRIQDSYNPRNPIEIIKPPVDLNNYSPSENIGDYYLVVSRLEYYKKVDLVINAFNKLERNLVIIGNGTLTKELKRIANPNITFLNNVSNENLAKYYSECKGLIFPQHEDYGITPLEACASGRPVIAYSKGGINDTMIPYSKKLSNEGSSTAVFFDDHSVKSLCEAIELFETLSFNKDFIVDHAKKFSEEIFRTKLKQFVDSKLNSQMNH